MQCRSVRATGEGGREKLSLSLPGPPVTAGRVPGTRPALAGGCGERRGAGEGRRGPLRETKQMFFSFPFCFWRSSKSLGPKRGEWILVQVPAVGKRGGSFTFLSVLLRKLVFLAQ